MTCPHCKKDTKIVKRRYADGKFDWMCQQCAHQVEEPAPETGAVILYDRMVLAINECHQTDEVKQIRDQALALEYYARQAKNIEAERKAAEIRIRAERRAGELLKETEKGKGGRPEKNSPQPADSLFAQAKKDANISDDQADRWQRLAEVPAEEFEKKVSDPRIIPSTSGLIDKPPSLKPIIDLPPPPKLDNNPRRCSASCCPEGSDISGPWNIHDAQRLLDDNDFPHGFFHEYHAALLKLFVEVYHLHAFEQVRGGVITRTAIDASPRLSRYKGLERHRRN